MAALHTGSLHADEATTHLLTSELSHDAEPYQDGAMSAATAAAERTRSLQALTNADEPLTRMLSFGTLPAMLPTAPALAGNILTQLCQSWLQGCMCSNVQMMMHSERGDLDPEGGGSDISEMNSQLSATTEEETEAGRSIRIVALLGRFYERVSQCMPPCFPEGWPVLEWAYKPVRQGVQDIAQRAAMDPDRIWSFQELMQLEESLCAFLQLSRDCHAPPAPVWALEASMQVPACARVAAFVHAVVYAHVHTFMHVR